MHKKKTFYISNHTFLGGFTSLQSRVVVDGVGKVVVGGGGIVVGHGLDSV